MISVWHTCTLIVLYFSNAFNRLSCNSVQCCCRIEEKWREREERGERGGEKENEEERERERGERRGERGIGVEFIITIAYSNYRNLQLRSNNLDLRLAMLPTLEWDRCSLLSGGVGCLRRTTPLPIWDIP